MNTIEARLDHYQPYMLSIFRIMVGLLFLEHGLQKWFGVPAVNPAYANIQLFTMVGMAGVIEIVCGSLVAVGLFTRYAFPFEAISLLLLAALVGVVVLAKRRFT